MVCGGGNDALHIVRLFRVTCCICCFRPSNALAIDDAGDLDPVSCGDEWVGMLCLSPSEPAAHGKARMSYFFFCFRGGVTGLFELMPP